MSNFKKESITCQYILEQLLWLNKYIEINNENVYWRSWIDAGILYINDIVHNGTCLTQDEIQFKYNLTTTNLAIIQIQGSIPKKWMKVLKQNVYAVPLLHIKKQLHINNSQIQL